MTFVSFFSGDPKESFRNLFPRLSEAEVSEMISSILSQRANYDFWKGVDSEAVRNLYGNASEADFYKIKPIWDLTHSAYVEHSDLAPNALEGGILYLAEREAFLRHHRDTGVYEYATFWKRSNRDRILRVVGHWLRGDSLTPPVYTVHQDRYLTKVGGHHRTAVALLSKSPWIPFYSQADIVLEGVVRFPEKAPRVRVWTPEMVAVNHHLDES